MPWLPHAWNVPKRQPRSLALQWRIGKLVQILELTLQKTKERAHALDLAQVGLRMAQEDLAGRGELHAARMAFEQWYAEVLLQFLDLAAERGLGNVQLLRRLADRSVPSNRGKITDGLIDHCVISLPPA